MGGFIAFLICGGLGVFIIYARLDRVRTYKDAAKNAPIGDRVESGIDSIGAYIFGAFCIFVGIVALFSIF